MASLFACVSHNLVPRRAPSKAPLYEVGGNHWPLCNICYIEVSGVYSEWCAYTSWSRMATRVLNYISQAFLFPCISRMKMNLMKISTLSHRNAWWWHVCPLICSVEIYWTWSFYIGEGSSMPTALDKTYSSHKDEDFEMVRIYLYELLMIFEVCW